MDERVEIDFDCLPLRSIGRLDIPIDASPRFRERCERIKTAIAKHGSHNSYFLHNAKCCYHLTNVAGLGMIAFSFEGTVLTDPTDKSTLSTDLTVTLVQETCDWLTEPVVQWFAATVPHSVMAEFDLYIQSGSLDQTLARIAAIQQQSDQQGGFLGMYL